MADEEIPPDEDIGPALIAVSSVLLFFALLTGFLRVFVRWRNRNLGWDDAMLVIGSAFGIARFAMACTQDKYNNGRHRHYISEEDYYQTNKYGWYGQIFLFLGICFLKLSIMLLIMRMKDSKILRYICWGTMAGLVVTNFGVVIILLAECKPMGFYRTDGECWTPQVRIYSIYFTVSYSVLTDLLCSFLPLVVVWRVRIPLKTKVMVVGLMSMGLLATGFGIARAASLGLKTDDLTYTYAVAALWSNIELFLGLTAANLALSRQVYQYFFPSSHQHSHPGSYFPRYGYGSSDPRSNYRFSRKLRDPTGGELSFAAQDTYVESSSNVRPSLSKSDGSEIPLEPGIRKKTEFWISEGDGDVAGQGQAGPTVEGPGIAR